MCTNQLAVAEPPGDSALYSFYHMQDLKQKQQLIPLPVYSELNLNIMVGFLS